MVASGPSWLISLISRPDLSGLPVSFAERIGDLAGEELVHHFSQSRISIRTLRLDLEILSINERPESTTLEVSVVYRVR